MTTADLTPTPDEIALLEEYAAEGRALLGKVCQECGRTYIPKLHAPGYQVFCETPCRQAAWNRRRRELSRSTAVADDLPPRRQS